MFYLRNEKKYNSENNSRREVFWIFLKTKRINIFSGTIILIILGTALTGVILTRAKKLAEVSPAEITVPEIHKKIKVEEAEIFKPKYDYVYTPVSISMEDVKTRGCVADGILSEYGDDTNSATAMINRSNCIYLHRALETWADPPDFKKATEIMAKIKKPEIIYGMFIAEAIRKGERSFEKDGEEFDFSDMCRKGSENVWGEHTCKPNIGSKEYREYLKEITREAMDIGIQSFLFGQIYYQDSSDLEKSKMHKVLNDMRSYAKEKGMDIIIGAQTGNITDENYLRMFDYIEGGVGMGEDGKIESGPCWSHMQSCWALLWNERYALKANNVLLHLDWSGLLFDDMSVFARMNKEKREKTLRYLYGYFTSRNIGFMMPMMATLNKQNNGCYGPKKGFYSAHRKYSCQDEDVINEILAGQK